MNFFKKNTGLLIRFDDIAENMNWQFMDESEILFDKYNIKPLLGVIPNNKDYSNKLVGQLKSEKSAQLDFPLQGHETGEQFKKVLENLGMSFVQKPYNRMSSVECFECWTVHSYAGDYNPEHDHPSDADIGLSCIMYLTIPMGISSGDGSLGSTYLISNNLSVIVIHIRSPSPGFVSN